MFQLHKLYDFLKPLSDVSSLEESDFIDWGNEAKYEKAVGVGECAGVVIDLIATLLVDSKDKIGNAQKNLRKPCEKTRKTCEK